MSTLQSLLSNIKVEQSGGAPMVPEDADGYVSLTPTGKNTPRGDGSTAAPHYGVPDELRLDNNNSAVANKTRILFSDGNGASTSFLARDS